jgi:hypothetical protein
MLHVYQGLRAELSRRGQAQQGALCCLLAPHNGPGNVDKGGVGGGESNTNRQRGRMAAGLGQNF